MSRVGNLHGLLAQIAAFSQFFSYSIRFIASALLRDIMAIVFSDVVVISFNRHNIGEYFLFFHIERLLFKCTTE